MSVVDEAVQDGVSQGGIAYDVVPVFDWNLTGDDGRSSTVAIVEYFQKVAPFGRSEDGQAPIIENEKLNASEGFEHASIAAVAASEGERLEEAWDALILNRAIVAACLVAQRASNPAFAKPGCPQNAIAMSLLRHSNPATHVKVVYDAVRPVVAAVMASMMTSKMPPEMVAAIMAEAEWHVNGRRVRIAVRREAVWIASIATISTMPMTIPAYVSLLDAFFAHSKNTGYRTVHNRQSSGRMHVDQAS